MNCILIIVISTEWVLSRRWRVFSRCSWTLPTANTASTLRRRKLEPSWRPTVLEVRPAAASDPVAMAAGPTASAEAAAAAASDPRPPPASDAPISYRYRQSPLLDSIMQQSTNPCISAESCIGSSLSVFPTSLSFARRAACNRGLFYTPTAHLTSSHDGFYAECCGNRWTCFFVWLTTS